VTTRQVRIYAIPLAHSTNLLPNRAVPCLLNWISFRKMIINTW
jgi:hypothetical protein